jgi:hypothetical protein
MIISLSPAKRRLESKKLEHLLSAAQPVHGAEAGKRLEKRQGEVAREQRASSIARNSLAKHSVVSIYRYDSLLQVRVRVRPAMSRDRLAQRRAQQAADNEQQQQDYDYDYDNQSGYPSQAQAGYGAYGRNDQHPQAPAA